METLYTNKDAISKKRLRSKGRDRFWPNNHTCKCKSFTWANSMKTRFWLVSHPALWDTFYWLGWWAHPQSLHLKPQRATTFSRGLPINICRKCLEVNPPLQPMTTTRVGSIAAPSIFPKVGQTLQFSQPSRAPLQIRLKPEHNTTFPCSNFSIPILLPSLPPFLPSRSQ